jgi:hypothetical protein
MTELAGLSPSATGHKKTPQAEAEASEGLQPRVLGEGFLSGLVCYGIRNRAVEL